MAKVVKTHKSVFSIAQISSFNLFMDDDFTATFKITYKSFMNNHGQYSVGLTRVTELSPELLADIICGETRQKQWKRDCATKIKVANEIVPNANEFFVGKDREDNVVIMAVKNKDGIAHIAKGVVFYTVQGPKKVLPKKHFFRFDSVNTSNSKKTPTIYMKGQHHSTISNADINAPIVNKTIGVRVTASVATISTDLALVAKHIDEDKLPEVQAEFNKEIEKRMKKAEQTRKAVETRRINKEKKKVEEARLRATEGQRLNALNDEFTNFKLELGE